ncbi:MAG: tetratricopeptide repeat protein [Planctomycetes bacterium]|nr:tetratricopeptide repeat protein [Planctomycetota bacterium]
MSQAKKLATRAFAFALALLAGAPRAAAQEEADASGLEALASALLDLELRGLVEGSPVEESLLGLERPPLEELLLARALARHAARSADPAPIEAWFEERAKREELADPLRSFVRAAARMLRERRGELPSGEDAWAEHAKEALLIGPFGDGGPGVLDLPFAPERALGLGFEAPGAFGPVRWMPLRREPSQRVFTTRLRLYPAVSAGYALLRVHVEREQPGYVHLGFASPLRAWWNEAPLFDAREEAQRASEDEAWLPVAFRAGENRLLLKLEDLSEAAFAVRYLDAAARPLAARELPADPNAELERNGPAAVEPPPPLERPSAYLARSEGFEASGVRNALRAMELFVDGRASEALRAAQRAAELAPEDPRCFVLISRLCEGAEYLPATFRRSRATEAIERALALDPANVAARREQALQRLAVDRAEETIEIARSLARELPHAAEPHLMLRRAFESLGWARELEGELRALAELRPRDPQVHRALAAAYGRRLDFAGELAALRAAQALQPSSPELLEQLQDRLILAGRSEEALQLLEEAVQRQPKRIDLRLRRASLLERFGRNADAAEIYTALARENPSDPDYPRWAGNAHMAAGAKAEALAAWERSLELEPGQPEVREALRAHGAPHGRELFERFAVDALAVARAYDPSSADRASSSELLVDLMVERVHRDGSRETLTQQLWFVVDEGGVRKHGEPKPSRGRTLAIRTIDREGVIHEPMPVRGAFTMPALAPGVFVEHSYVDVTGPERFPTSSFTSFFFASEDQPFRFTRYVLALPKGAPYDLRRENFDGEHEVLEEPEETIHVFTRRDVPRVPPESFSPPREKFLPWVSAQPLVPPSALARRIHAGFLEGTETTQELLAFVEEAIRGVSGDAARARALYDAVQRVVRDPSSDGGNATRTLLEGKGDPLELYVACLRACGIPFRPALARAVWPELDPDPRGLANPLGRYGAALLQLLPRDGEPRWIGAPALRLPFGRFSEELEGGEVFVSAGTSGQIEHLPRLASLQHAQSHAKLEVHLEESSRAKLFLDLELPSTSGYANAEQVSRIPERDQRRVLANVISQLAPGLEVSAATFVDLDDPTKPLRVRAEGQIARFAAPEEGLLSTPLGLRPLLLSRALGADAARQRPYALPGAGAFAGERFERVRVVLVPPSGRRLAAAPEPHLERFGGLSYALVVEREGERLILERTLSLQPCELAPSEMRSFLEALQRIDTAERQRTLWR